MSHRLLVIALVGFAIVGMGSRVFASDSVTAILAAPQSITGPDNICRKVTNGSPTGMPLYVPVASASEWQSFVAHPPTGVTVDSCSLCPAGQIQIPDEAPGVCGKLMTVYSGFQYGNGLCGENYADIGRCGYGDPASVPGYASCYYSFQTRGTCIEGYNCPYDGWTGWYDAATQAVSPNCNSKTWDSAYPGARCVPRGQLGAHDCLFDQTAQHDVSVTVLDKLGGYTQGVCYSGDQVGANQSYTFTSPPHVLAVEGHYAIGSGGASLIQSQFWIRDADGTLIYTSPYIASGTYYIPLVKTSTYTVTTYGYGCNGGAADQLTLSSWLVLKNLDMPSQCSDSIDNDGNGTADMADGCSCSSTFDDLEAYDGHLCTSQCSDGIDNNGNGYSDTADYCGCSAADDNIEAYDANLCPWGDYHLDYSGTVICTELHRQGLMPDEWMSADKSFGHKMPALVMDGYHFWANPVVKLMRRSHAFTMFVYTIAHPWAQEMAHLEGVEREGSLTGIYVMVVGIPISALFGILFTPWL